MSAPAIESEAAVKPRLKTRYNDEVRAALQQEFEFANVMQIPGVVKVVVNMGVGEAARDAKLIEGAVRDLATITGQKPVVTRARKSIAQFKLREGMPIGRREGLDAPPVASMWSAHSKIYLPVRQDLAQVVVFFDRAAVLAYLEGQAGNPVGRPEIR